MNKNYYFIEHISGKEKEDLEKQLISLKLRYQSPERGGGGIEESIKVVVAWINLNDFWVGFFASLAASRAEKVLSALWKWYASHKNTLDNKVEYRAKIFIYNRRGNVELDLPIRHKYSKNDIYRLIKKLQK